MARSDISKTTLCRSLLGRRFLPLACLSLGLPADVRRGSPSGPYRSEITQHQPLTIASARIGHGRAPRVGRPSSRCVMACCHGRNGTLGRLGRGLWSGACCRLRFVGSGHRCGNRWRQRVHGRGSRRYRPDYLSQIDDQRRRSLLTRRPRAAFTAGQLVTERDWPGWPGRRRLHAAEYACLIAG